MRNCDVRLGVRLSRAVLLGLIVTSAAALQAQSGSVPVRVAIVGLVHDHVMGFLHQLPQHPELQLVGIEDPDAALAAKYEKQFRLSHDLFFQNTDAMIEARHPQALLVYTSVADHRKVIELAGKYGIAVMVEKPLTISLEDALAIRRVAREKHIQVLVNYETTWYASNRAAYEQVERGEIGQIRRVVVHDGHQGPKEIGVSPTFLNWLTDPAQNGAGSLYDFGCYGVDLMTWLMHGETPLTVTAVVNHDKPAVYPKADDDSTIILDYPHAQAVLMGSWDWPFARKDMEVYGATGYAITVAEGGLRVRHEHDAAEQTMTAPALVEKESNSYSYLAAVLRGEIKPEGDLTALDTNVTVMQILDAARESARTGKSVRLTKVSD